MTRSRALHSTAQGAPSCRALAPNRAKSGRCRGSSPRPTSEQSIGCLKGVSPGFLLMTGIRDFIEERIALALTLLFAHPLDSRTRYLGCLTAVGNIQEWRWHISAAQPCAPQDIHRTLEEQTPKHHAVENSNNRRRRLRGFPFGRC